MVQRPLSPQKPDAVRRCGIRDSTADLSSRHEHRGSETLTKGSTTVVRASWQPEMGGTPKAAGEFERPEGSIASGFRGQTSHRSGILRLSKKKSATRTDGERIQEAGVSVNVTIGGGGCGDGIAEDGGGDGGRVVCGKSKQPSPAAHAASLLTPAASTVRTLPSGGASAASRSVGGISKPTGTSGPSSLFSGSDDRIADHTIIRTPMKTPPSSGSSSFLYEPETSQDVMRTGSWISSEGGDLAGPSHEACRLVAGNRDPLVAAATAAGAAGGCGAVAERDVFARGPQAIADFSAVWRRSHCFAFVLGGRSVPRVGMAKSLREGVDGGNGGGGAGRCGRRSESEYERSWEGLTSPALPVAPYTVPSAGESFMPVSRRENEDK